MKHKTLFSSIYFLFIIAILGCAGKKQTDISQPTGKPAISHYYEALSFIESHEYENALMELDSAITQRPRVAQFYYAKGQVLELMKRPHPAIEAYEAALEVKSFFPEVWRRLAYLYMEHEKYAPAVNVLNNLVSQMPDSLEYELMLGDALLHSGQPRLAQKHISIYESRGGRSPEFERIKGLADYAEGNYKQAAQNLEEYAHRSNKNFEVDKALGISLIKIGDLEEGVSHLNGALEQNADDPEIYLYRSRYFMKRNKSKSALEQLNVALQIDSTDAEVLLEKGKFMLSRGDTTEAEVLILRSLKYDPDCIECLKLLGIIDHDRGNLRKALGYFQRYLQKSLRQDPEVEQRVEDIRKNLN